MRVRFLVAEAQADGVDAAQSRVGVVGHGRTRLGLDLAQEVNDDALAQRPVAGAQRVYRERAHRAFEYLTARDDNLRPLRADAVDAAPLRLIRLGHPLVEACEATQDDLRAHGLSALRLLLRVLRAQRLADGEYRPR